MRSVYDGYVYFSVVGRILEADECPLEVQSRWRTGDQGTFTLTQAEFEVKIVINNLKITVFVRYNYQNNSKPKGTRMVKDGEGLKTANLRS